MAATTPPDDTPPQDDDPGGLSLSVQFPADADVILRQPPLAPTDLWRSIFDPWSDSTKLPGQLVTGVRALAAGRDAGEFHEQLASITALDGVYQSVIEWLATDPNVDVDPDDADTGDRFWHAISITRSLGTGRPLGLQTKPYDIRTGPLEILRIVGIEPSIAIGVDELWDAGDGSWTRRRSQREKLLEFLGWLAEVADVQVVASPATLAKLREDHADDLPASVVETPHPLLTEPGVTDVDQEQAQAALDEIPSTGREWDLLRVIEEHGGECARRELYNDVRLGESRGSIRDALATLRSRSCVSSNGPRNAKVEVITPTGELALEVLRARDGRKTELTDFESTPETGPENRLADAVYSEASTRDPPAGDRPDGEADSGRTSRWSGRVDVDYVPNWGRHHAAVASAPENGGIGLVDRPMEKRTGRDGDEDGRIPWWGYDEDRDEVVVSYEWHGPRAGMVCNVRALLSDDAFREIFTVEAFDGDDGDLSGLLNGNRWALRALRQLGYLKTGMSASEYRDALQEARDDFVELTNDIEREKDQPELYAEILRLGHGLSTIAADLYDILGIDVVREISIPHFNRDYWGREERVRGLLKFLSMRMTQSSRYGEYSAWRVLCEPRTEKRQVIGNGPDVDAADPRGTVQGSWVLTGKGVSKLRPYLDHLDREGIDLQEDEPGFQPFTLDFVLDDRRRTPIKRAAKRMLQQRGLKPTEEAISILEAFCGDAYDATEAISALEGEPIPRHVRINELKYGLAQLDVDRIMPDLVPTKRKALKALLCADDPLSQSEIADRGGFSPRSFRNHRDELEAFDIIETTDDGKYRLTISYRGEKNRVPTVVDDSISTLSDVLWEAAYDLIDDPSRFGDPDDPQLEPLRWPPDFDELASSWPLMDRWLSIAAALANSPRRNPDTITVGKIPEQSSLQEPLARPTANAD
ncbi:plasmid replication protein [Halobacterium phage phiH]|uniref:Plasmid replication protein n=1 Tax=Halobacterium phage phiH TaxID=169684 RepID=A0A3G1ZKW9_BPPHH|nr:replication protein [Halobacterium phage phiH]AYM00303.1 plasmid replication protein [Halobacterium phage phiH]